MPLAASSGGSSFSLLLIILIPVALYFLMIRPQQKRMRQAQAMQATLGPGDEVMTSSGIYGTVVDVDDEAGTIGLEIAEDIVVTFARGAVAKVVTSAGSAEQDDEQDDDEVDDAGTGTDAAGDVDATDQKIIERRD